MEAWKAAQDVKNTPSPEKSQPGLDKEGTRTSASAFDLLRQFESDGAAGVEEAQARSPEEESWDELDAEDTVRRTAICTCIWV